MTAAFSWLNDLMAWVGLWFPRVVLIPQRQRLVCFRPGGRVTAHEPGLFVYWPIIHQVQRVSLALRTMELAGQLHGQELVQIVIGWHVTDPVKMLLTINDPVAFLDDNAAAALAVAMESEPGPFPPGMPKAANHQISELTLENLRRLVPSTETGMNVDTVAVSQRGRVIAHKGFNDWAQHESRRLDGAIDVPEGK